MNFLFIFSLLHLDLVLGLQYHIIPLMSKEPSAATKLDWTKFCLWINGIPNPKCISNDKDSQASEIPHFKNAESKTQPSEVFYLYNNGGNGKHQDKQDVDQRDNGVEKGKVFINQKPNHHEDLIPEHIHYSLSGKKGNLFSDQKPKHHEDLVPEHDHDKSLSNFFNKEEQGDLLFERSIQQSLLNFQKLLQNLKRESGPSPLLELLGASEEVVPTNSRKRGLLWSHSNPNSGQVLSVIQGSKAREPQKKPAAPNQWAQPARGGDPFYSPSYPSSYQ